MRKVCYEQSLTKKTKRANTQKTVIHCEFATNFSEISTATHRHGFSTGTRQPDLQEQRNEQQGERESML